MDFYLDTEFNGFGGELLSIGIAPADTSLPCFYAAIKRTEALAGWVAMHVIPFIEKLPEGVPILGSAELVDRERAARMLVTYLRTVSPGEKPVFVADWPEDFAQLMNLLVIGPGQIVNSPDFDCQYRALRGFNTAETSTIPHNALADAIALRDYCLTL
jgi:hypothetical protein